MREQGRIKQGYFPTPDIVVQQVAKALMPMNSDKGIHALLDAGCGDGAALKLLAQEWRKASPKATIKTHGIESDFGRYEAAKSNLDVACWSCIEDVELAGHVSVLWFNPPYDRVRKGERLELSLLRQVKDWPLEQHGFLVGIFPDYIVADTNVGLGYSLHYDFELVRRWRFPADEYKVFKQVVVICRRRRDGIHGSTWEPNPFDRARDWGEFNELENCYPITGCQVAPRLQVQSISPHIARELAKGSAARNLLLRSATAKARTWEKPPLPLGAGHLTLALFGGLCDGEVTIKNAKGEDERVIVKGSLERHMRKSGDAEKFDRAGKKTADVEIHRTFYDANVRVLRPSRAGVIETYGEKGDELTEDIDGKEDAE